MNEPLEYPVPPSWGWTAIEDVTSYVQRGKSPKYADRSNLPVINQRCIRWHGVEAEHLKFIDKSQWAAWGPERTLRDGDILWNSTGTGTIGRAAIYRPLAGFERVVADSHVTVLRVKSVLPEYLHAWIRSPSVQARIDAMQVGSTNQVELGRGEVLRTRVPVAPAEEQRRIVAKLEALQARSRRARDALEAVPQLLERLRQSILAAAFRGDLTKDWRAKQKDVEPAPELLERIRTERRKNWEISEVTKSKAKDKRLTDQKWKARYREPAAVDPGALAELPEGWCWASLAEVAPLQPGFAFPSSGFRADGVRLLKGINVRDGWISLEELHHWDQQDSRKYAPYRLRSGDIVLAMDRPVYSSGSRRTKVARLDKTWEGGLLLQRVGRFQSLSLLNPDYLMLFVESFIFRDHLISRQNGTQDGKDLPHVSAGMVDSAVVPIPSLQEQVEIVRIAESAVAAIGNLEKELPGASSRLAALDNAVLGHAFAGKLVPQEANDEPAEAMLARARSTSGSASANGSTSKRGRPRSTHSADQPND
jgi:type I restriction enzyme S subunit